MYPYWNHLSLPAALRIVPLVVWDVRRYGWARNSPFRSLHGFRPWLSCAPGQHDRDGAALGDPPAFIGLHEKVVIFRDGRRPFQRSRFIPFALRRVEQEGRHCAGGFFADILEEGSVAQMFRDEAGRAVST